MSRKRTNGMSASMALCLCVLVAVAAGCGGTEATGPGPSFGSDGSTAACALVVEYGGAM